MKKVILSTLMVLCMACTTALSPIAEVRAEEATESTDQTESGAAAEISTETSVDSQEALGETADDETSYDIDETGQEKVFEDNEIGEMEETASDITGTEAEGTVHLDDEAESVSAASGESAAEEPKSISFELTLEYDDRYSFSDFREADLSGYEVLEIDTETVLSYQVSEGMVLDEPDPAVIEQDGEDGLIAVGVGTAEVLLYNETENAEIVLRITVEPATLTVIYIAGQSNAEGASSSAIGDHTENSILCPEGEVYSTYAPSSASYAVKNTGLSGFTASTVSNAADFVAGSLTDSTSISGEKLVYPLNALTASGGGKTGIDSGLAYNWNALTGDKVWVVNAAWSGSSIKRWIPDTSAYERALPVYRYASATADAEIASGHYVQGGTLMFWLQGESDRTMAAEDYISYFETMIDGYEENSLGIEEYGLIMVRASTGSYTTDEDLYMTGPRIAQYLIGNSADYPNIHVVSNVNEQWVTDSGVADYFRSVYGNSLTYPLRENASISAVPTTVAEVHADIHYSQVGHNENGLTAAQTMYEIVKGGQNSLSSVNWYGEDGVALSPGEQVTLAVGSSYTFVPVAEQLELSEQIGISVSGSVFSYNASTGQLTVAGKGSGTLTATLGKNSCTRKLVAQAKLETPSLRSASAGASGTCVTWSAVDDADGYVVFRKISGGSWSIIAHTTSTSYTDTAALSGGKTYYYTVRAYRGSYSTACRNKYSTDYWSSYVSNGIGSVYLAVPALSKTVINTASGIKISWGKVSGASGYAVYRKTSGGSWTMIKTTTDVSYTDTGAAAGTTYYYTVRAYYGNVSTARSNQYNALYWGGYDQTGVSGRFLKTPALKSAGSTATGTRISWSAVSGASGYAVFRKISGGSWSIIAHTTSTSYTDTAALSGGKTYYYTVRAYRGSWSTVQSNKYLSVYWSYFDTPVLKSVYIKAPTLKSASRTSSGIKVSWGSVSGASGYAVYRKTSGGSWKRIATTTSTSYTDKSGKKKGTIYYYTVRAYKGSQSTALKNLYDAAYWGGYNNSGVSAVWK